MKTSLYPFFCFQIKEDDLSPGPEGPLQPPSPFLIVANKFMGGESFKRE